ncbi:hypothetical protein ANN_02211 [Periplaneta americana]|uniref:Phosphorylase b kinase regulatory subunit n=1 Tax=Periplaneta americana TaxID=6978 RepID=A0ABQ8TY41_PERAM|nr:hypothetical protein ANN_02211 [Periplaneta americana]
MAGLCEGGNEPPDQGKIPLAMITTMKKLKSGYINGTRVALGNLNDFLSTSCITNLSFLGSQEDGLPDRLNPQVQTYLEEHLLKSLTPRSQLLNRPAIRKGSTMRRRMSVKGAIKKTRSIAVERNDDDDDDDDITWELEYSEKTPVLPDH